MLVKCIFQLVKYILAFRIRTGFNADPVQHFTPIQGGNPMRIREDPELDPNPDPVVGTKEFLISGRPRLLILSSESQINTVPMPIRILNTEIYYRVFGLNNIVLVVVF
jgi:hypothetical protein